MPYLNSEPWDRQNLLKLQIMMTAEPFTSGSVKKFPLAAQPEIMRAAEKDDQYASFVFEDCRNVFHHLFGTRVVVAYQKKANLLGQMLYYMLTTGAGKQTLGEEYCDITLIEGIYDLSFLRRV